MEKKEFTKEQIVILITISIIIVLLFWDTNTIIESDLYQVVQPFICKLFTPLKLYTTAIHEGWHAFITLITGGSIKKIHLDINGSGHAISKGGIFVLIAPAGYIGSAITGALLIISAKKEIISKVILSVISSVILYLNLVYIDSYLSIAFISSILTSIFIIISIFKTNSSSYIAIFLGTILAVNSFEDIKIIIFKVPYQTDAGILARNLGMEFLTIPISIIISIICMYIWWKSIKYIMKN